MTSPEFRLLQISCFRFHGREHYIVCAVLLQLWWGGLSPAIIIA